MPVSSTSTSSRTLTVSKAQLREGVELRTGQLNVLIVGEGDGPTEGGEQTEPGASATSLETSLREPRWLEPELVHGAEAAMEVLADNADGRAIRFLVERKEDGEWQPHSSTDGRVEAGKARAQIVTEHPQHADGDPFVECVEVELRFRVEFASIDSD